MIGDLGGSVICDLGGICRTMEISFILVIV